ncbi:RAD55 family ATPase [Methanosalsum natronophilum]|uniref:ATPase n=1 Tax=Methanosalsum natronophilum TaxID=768733 RepID=A0A424YPV3_9EURY|nr:ATPase domain-containing protein [Methanosalsum natronophilum]MCS3923936.1 KaiC/GvpD/RAD55 family RecA-like ATPase [Methanosalsum natronophilum]RQD81045.1 MAG: ATPase [Methanosalsum natronophilum]
MRIATGIDGFDELIEGGFLDERVYLVSGPPGCGKTTFGMQFLLQGAKTDDVGLYVTLLESPQNIIDDISNYSLNLQSYIKSRKVLFADLGPRLEYSSVNNFNEIITPEYEIGTASIENEAPSPALVYKEIANYVNEYNVKRLVIDSLSAIRFTAKDISLEEKEMSRFVRHLKKLGCTTVLISEMTDPQSYTTEQFASHGVIFLHNFLYGKSMVRALQVIKMRGTKHDCDMRTVEFNKSGLKVSNKLE